MMHTIALTGIRGDNPMSFLAGLGIVRVIPNAKLWWEKEGLVHAYLESDLAKDDLVNVLYEVKERTLASPLFAFDDVRLEAEETKAFLASGFAEEYGVRRSLITDITVDESKGLAKPFDLYFTSGQQRFLSVVQEIGQETTKERLEEGIFGPWRYSAVGCKTLTLDPRDDRNHALMATEPSTTPKQTMPALDWLAFIGFSFLPVFGTLKRVLTPGASGSAGSSAWAWVLWDKPLNPDVIRTVLQQIPRDKQLEQAGWPIPKGVFSVYQSDIIRVGQGYGRFAPPKLVIRR